MNTNWLNQLGGVLDQYSGVSPQQVPDSVYDDFDQVAQNAPQSALSGGLADAFRSDQTPPFGQMLGQLFGQSSGYQRAGILNTLIATLGPTLVAQFLSRKGTSGLAGALSGGQQEITLEQAEQIPPEAVQELAAQAEKQDPSVVDRLSDLYAQHPTLIKTLGSAALAIALAKVSQEYHRT